MRQTRFLRAGGRLALVAAAAGALLALPAVGHASSGYPAHKGYAWGTKVTVGSTLKSGPSFLTVMGPCHSQPGDVAAKTGAGVNVLGYVSTGSISNRIAAFWNSTRTTSRVEDVSVLGGRVTASAVVSVSEVGWNGTSFTFADGSWFAGVRVNGVAVTVHANQTITIPGIGYVVLDQQRRWSSGVQAVQTVNAIHVVVTKTNSLGIPVGTNILVGTAIAGLVQPVGGLLSGEAYGSYAHYDSAVLSSKSWEAPIGCLGGAYRNAGASTVLPSIGSTGAVTDTIWGSVRATQSTVRAISTVYDVELLNGLIKASVLKADVAGVSAGTPSFTDRSSAGSITVNGKTVGVAANTKVTIPGLGYLYVHHVVRRGDSDEVRMLDLWVTQANVFAVPLGTNVRVAVARAGFR